MTFVNWPFDFSTATTEPPTSTQVRLDAGHPYTTVTKLWARNLTNSGIDVKMVLLATPTGATLYLQDQNESALFGRFTTTGAAVDKATYVEFPIAWTANGGALNNNQAVQLAILTDATLPDVPPSGPALVSLVEAKDHLRITDTVHDADLQAKLAEAEAIVLDFVGGDPATALDVYKAGIKLMLAHLYENRGEAEQTVDEAVWEALWRLFRRLRAPALS